MVLSYDARNYFIFESMLYRTLKELEKMKAIKVSKMTGKGFKISESSRDNHKCISGTAKDGTGSMCA